MRMGWPGMRVVTRTMCMSRARMRVITRAVRMSRPGVRVVTRTMRMIRGSVNMVTRAMRVTRTGVRMIDDRMNMIRLGVRVGRSGVYMRGKRGFHQNVCLGSSSRKLRGPDDTTARVGDTRSRRTAHVVLATANPSSTIRKGETLVRCEISGGARATCRRVARAILDRQFRIRRAIPALRVEGRGIRMIPLRRTRCRVPDSPAGPQNVSRWRRRPAVVHHDAGWNGAQGDRGQARSNLLKYGLNVRARVVGPSVSDRDGTRGIQSDDGNRELQVRGVRNRVNEYASQRFRTCREVPDREDVGWCPTSYGIATAYADGLCRGLRPRHVPVYLNTVLDQLRVRSRVAEVQIAVER